MENLEWYSENSKNEIYDISYILGFKGRKTNLVPYGKDSMVICSFPEVAEELLNNSKTKIKNWAERNFSIKEIEICERSISFISQFKINTIFESKLTELESIEIPFSIYAGNYDLEEKEILYSRSAKNEHFSGHSCDTSAYSVVKDEVYDNDLTVYDTKSGEPVFVYDIVETFPDFSNKKITVNKCNVFYGDRATLDIWPSSYCVDSSENPAISLENVTGFKSIQWYHDKPCTMVRPRIPVSDIYLDGDTYYLRPEAYSNYKEIFDNLKKSIDKQKKDIYESIGLESFISKFNDSHKIL